MAYLLQQLLLGSANRFPDKTAVWAAGRSITYRELNEHSNQLAHSLRYRGVKRGDRVGLYFPKSVESVISMLGVLKAEAVYVPLDPNAPAARIRYILANCGTKLLITTSTKLQSISPAPLVEGGYSILIDQNSKANPDDHWIGWDALSSFPAGDSPPCDSVDTDLGYILYTSGSTGDPKGVMLTHRNALTFVDWCAETFRVQPEDRLSNHAPLHFDLSVFDIYNGLAAGATIYMVPEQIAAFPADVATFIEKHEISVWYSVPSALVYLVLHGKLASRDLEHLRLVLFAGEPFAMKYLRQLVDLLPRVELYNLYGPTETNVCTYYRVNRELLPTLDRLPIGKACANTQVFAVNEQDELIGLGEEGELYVRGPSVTYGYWGDPEKTREAVLHNRFQPNFSEKIYRTGDLVTVDDAGNYEFRGRRDHMIKSRGYRIELGEIEAALYQHDAIKEAAAVAIRDDEIGNRIKAFVVPNRPTSVTTADIQQHCVQCIPRYMVPEVIEFCEALPKTSTGKIDRKRLAQSGGENGNKATA